jgi:hypothetical protein
VRSESRGSTSIAAMGPDARERLGEGPVNSDKSEAPVGETGAARDWRGVWGNASVKRQSCSRHTLRRLVVAGITNLKPNLPRNRLPLSLT